MAHWLFKSEPSSWSWEQQVAAGDKGTFWSGVRNHTAKLNLIAMRRGEQGFFYHSGEGKEIVGIVEVIKEYYPDHTDPTGKFGMVDLKALRALPKAVTLEAIKSEPKLAEMALVRLSRLSVQPVTDEEWRIVCRMGGL
jgi:predicted RNA-binding protein with PUA-like domain